MSCRKRCWGLSCLFNPDVDFSEVVGKIFRTSLVDLAKHGYLRSFLKRFTGSMRLISTDRMFLVPLIHRTIPMLLPMYAGIINHDLLYMYIFTFQHVLCMHDIIMSWYIVFFKMCNMIPTCVGDLLAFFENASLSPPRPYILYFTIYNGAPEAVVKKNQLDQAQWQQQGWVGQHEWRQRCQMYPDGTCESDFFWKIKSWRNWKNLPNGTQPNDRLQGVNVCCLNWELLDVTGTLLLEKPLPPLCRTGVAQRLPPW